MSAGQNLVLDMAGPYGSAPSDAALAAKQQVHPFPSSFETGILSEPSETKTILSTTFSSSEPRRTLIRTHDLETVHAMTRVDATHIYSLFLKAQRDQRLPSSQRGNEPGEGAVRNGVELGDEEGALRPKEFLG